MSKRKKYIIPVSLAISSLPIIPKTDAPKNLDKKVEPNAKSDEDSTAIKALRQQDIYNNDFVRNTFYSWTTKAQIEELRKGSKLLTKSQSDKGEKSLFDLALRDTTFSKFPLAKVLSQDKFKNKRFAWTTAWATVMGWQKENYGDQLLQIILKDDAIIGSFNQTAKDHPFVFYNMKGEVLADNYVIKNQDKIAAIYHVCNKKFKRTTLKYYSKRNSTMYQTRAEFKNAEVEYREYIIINEAMIKSWAYGTKEISGTVQKEIDVLNAFNAEVKKENYTQRSYLSYDALWRNDGQIYESEKNEIDNVFRAATCVENDYYLLRSENLNAIIKTLQKNMQNQGQPVTSK